MNNFAPPSATHFDVIVVGGGLTGLAASIALAKTGLRTLQIAPGAPPDRRTSALMMPSIEFLTSSGLISGPEAIAHPLRRIRIIDATERLVRAPETLFDARDAGLYAFGWNFPNEKLSETFAAAQRNLGNLEHRSGSVSAVRLLPMGAALSLSDGTTVSAPLIVGADGKTSMIRTTAGFRTVERKFTEAALVCDLELARPLESTSIEFHYRRGPFTLVPAGANRANLVWIDDRGILDAARNGTEDALMALFAQKSQRLFGPMKLLTKTHVFALSRLAVDRAGAKGIVLIGEAAHAFPPIGAQGLNLGLRDVADLVAATQSADARQPDWANTVSADYADRRIADLKRTGTMVDTLFRSLLSDYLPAQALRAAGLWGLKLAPGLRRTAFRIGMGQG